MKGRYLVFPGGRYVAGVAVVNMVMNFRIQHKARNLFTGQSIKKYFFFSKVLIISDADTCL